MDLKIGDVGKDLIKNRDRLIEATWRAIVGEDTPKSEDGELIVQRRIDNDGPAVEYSFMYKGELAAVLTKRKTLAGPMSYFLASDNVTAKDVMKHIEKLEREGGAR